MRIEIEKQKLKQRCEEIVENISGVHVKDARERVREEFVKINTKKRFLRKDIEPPKKIIDKMMDNNDLVAKTWSVIGKDPKNYCQIGTKWLRKAKETLIAIETMQDNTYVTLTSDDDMALLVCWGGDKKKEDKNDNNS